MAKVGWEGIEVLDNQAKQETKNEQLEIDKSYARTFETEEGNTPPPQEEPASAVEEEVSA